MQKRFRAAGAALFICLAGMLLWQFLRACGPFYQGKPLTVWLRQLDTFSPSTAKEWEAAEAIRQIGDRAVPRLTHMLTNTDSSLRLQARSLLGRLRIPVPTLRDDSGSALAAFKILGPRAKSAVLPLAQTLQGGKLGLDQNCTVALALGAIGPGGWKVLGEALSSTNMSVWWAGAKALDIYHVDDRATVDCLIRAATNYPDRTGRFFSVLSRCKSERKRVLSFFIRELGSASVNTRKAAMEGLGDLGEASEQVIPLLGSALQSTNEEEVLTALRALGKLGLRGEASEQVIPLLRSALQSTNEEEVLTAVSALGQFGARAKEVEPALLDLIQSSAAGGGKYFFSRFVDPVKGIGPQIWRYATLSAEAVQRIYALVAALDRIDSHWRNKLPPGLATGPTLGDWLALGKGMEPHAEGPTLQQWLLMTKGEEPQYQARPLKHWLDHGRQLLSATPSLDLVEAERLAARNAVRGIGTNAIPWLLSWLQSENRSDALLARRGFGFLDGAARSALAALIELAQSNARETRTRAYGCIYSLGLNWDTVWLAVLPALHHSDLEVREDAAWFLMGYYPEEAQSVGIGDFIPLRQ